MRRCFRMLTTGIHIGDLPRPASRTSSNVKNMLCCFSHWASKEGILLASRNLEKHINDMSGLKRFELFKRIRDW